MSYALAGSQQSPPLNDYDCLTPAGIAVASASRTPQEQAAAAFNKQFPRELPAGLRHLNYYWRKHKLDRIDLTQVTAVSEATTGYMPGLRLVHIAKLVRHLKPKRVVELGSGVFDGALCPAA